MCWLAFSFFAQYASRIQHCIQKYMFVQFIYKINWAASDKHHNPILIRKNNETFNRIIMYQTCMRVLCAVFASQPPHIIDFDVLSSPIYYSHKSHTHSTENNNNINNKKTYSVEFIRMNSPFVFASDYYSIWYLYLIDVIEN